MDAERDSQNGSVNDGKISLPFQRLLPLVAVVVD